MCSGHDEDHPAPVRRHGLQDRRLSQVTSATAPISGDANKHVVPGILRTYDATALDPIKNADGTARLKLSWDGTHVPRNHFGHSKFCPRVVTDGKVFVPTYNGRVDVYTLAVPTGGHPLPTNANLGGHHHRH